MTDLAYDPQRLQALARRMTAAVAELQRIESADPAAADTVHVARSALHGIDRQWLPLIRLLLTTDPLALRNDGTDLMDTTVLRLDSAGARSLGQMLDTVNLDELCNDPQQWTMLTAELRLIDRDPALRAAFRANFRGWTRVADALAGERAWRASAADASSVSRLDALFARLAGELDDDLGQLATLQPYTAALMVQHLQLDPLALAEVADALILRWCDEPWTEASIGTASQFAERSQPNPADILFPLIAVDRRAALRYVALAGTHPRTLFAATTQPQLAHRIVLTATDPAHVSVATAGRLLVPLLDWFRAGDDRCVGTVVDDEQWALFLADAVAPWTWQLGPLNHDWQLTPDHQRQLVALLAQEDATLDRLVQQTDTVRQGLLAHAAGSTALEEFGAYLGMLQQVIVDRRLTDARRAAAGWSMLIGLAGLAGGLIPGGLAVSLVVGVGVGVLGSLHPRGTDLARHDAEFAKEATLTTAAASVAAAVHQQWIANGALPAGFPPPPTPQPGVRHPGLQFRDDLDTWLAHLPGGIDGGMADHVDRMVSTLMNAADAGAAVAR